MDDFGTEQTIHALVTRVASMLGKPPTFDGLALRSERLVIVNGDAVEQIVWIEQTLLVVGPGVTVTFVEHPLAVRSCGSGMIAARGRGTLDFQHFECGCRAAQIPGEDDYQLIRGFYCRFAPDQHQLRPWPIDLIRRPPPKPKSDPTR